MPENQSTNLQKKINLILIPVAALVLALGWYLSNQVKKPTKPPELKVGTQLTPAKVIPDMQLVDHDAKPFGLEQFKGQWNFIFFGYTNCPDVCPATLFQFKLMAKILEKHPDINRSTRFVLVSVDPDRDTAQHLKKYVQHYNPNFLGLTGEQKQLYTFSRNMGVIYAKQQATGEDKTNYLVDHSAAMLVMNPQGHLQLIFSAPHQADKIMQDYISLRNFYRANAS